MKAYYIYNIYNIYNIYTLKKVEKSRNFAKVLLIITPNRKKIGRFASPEFLSVGDLSEKENEFVSFFFPDGVIYWNALFS